MILSERQQWLLDLAGKALDDGDIVLAASYHRLANITAEQRAARLQALIDTGKLSADELAEELK